MLGSETKKERVIIVGWKKCFMKYDNGGENGTIARVGSTLLAFGLILYLLGVVVILLRLIVNLVFV
jgi:hypothetical protein